MDIDEAVAVTEEVIIIAEAVVVSSRGYKRAPLSGSKRYKRRGRSSS